MQVQGYKKKTADELLKAIDSCRSIGQLCALVQHENIVIQMKSQNAASNIPFTPLAPKPDVSPLDSLKAQVREAVLSMKKNRTKEDLICAVDRCDTIDSLFALVKREHIVIQMKSQNAASCIPMTRFNPAGLNPLSSPLDRLKDQVKSAIIYGG